MILDEQPETDSTDLDAELDDISAMEEISKPQWVPTHDKINQSDQKEVQDQEQLEEDESETQRKNRVQWILLVLLTIVALAIGAIGGIIAAIIFIH